MWKPRGYEAPEWNDATDIMIDQARQIGNLKARIEKRRKRDEAYIKLREYQTITTRRVKVPPNFMPGGIPK